MIQYKSLVQYTRVVDAIRFPQNINKPVMFVYFSENSSFLNDYTRLKLKRQDFRHAIIPLTKIPITRLIPEIRNGYKQFGLLPFSSNMNYPSDKNLIYDTTVYTKEVDKIYKPNTYRQRAGYLIQNLLMKTFQSFPENYRKILVYSVDTTREANDFVNKKIFPILRQLKADEIFFDEDYFLSSLSLKKLFIKSIGTGNTIVEAFSAEISERV